MRRHVTSLISVLIATVCTIASSGIPSRFRIVRPDIMGCENGCMVAAGGWPFAYVVDGMNTSPVGSADLMGALIGLDDLHWDRFGATFLIWLVAVAVVLVSLDKKS